MDESTQPTHHSLPLPSRIDSPFLPPPHTSGPLLGLLLRRRPLPGAHGHLRRLRRRRHLLHPAGPARGRRAGNYWFSPPVWWLKAVFTISQSRLLPRSFVFCCLVEKNSIYHHHHQQGIIITIMIASIHPSSPGRDGRRALRHQPHTVRFLLFWGGVMDAVWCGVVCGHQPHRVSSWGCLGSCWWSGWSGVVFGRRLASYFEIQRCVHRLTHCQMMSHPHSHTTRIWPCPSFLPRKHPHTH